MILRKFMALAAVTMMTVSVIWMTMLTDGVALRTKLVPIFLLMPVMLTKSGRILRLAST